MKKYILFDLDGTLTDPKEGITKSFQYALKQMGIDEPDLDSLEKVIGPPIWDNFMLFYGMDRSQADKAVQFYRERFSAVGKFENIPYPGIHALLKRLKDQGKILYVATSKPTVYAKEIVDHFGLGDFFTEVVGSELDGRRVNKKEIIQYILDKHRGEARSAFLMVGDREHDILGAKQCGIDSCGVLYGYGSFDELREQGATFIVEEVEEIEDVCR